MTGQQGTPGWDLAHGEPGEQSESRVEGGDDALGEPSLECTRAWHLKVRDEPSGAGCEMRPQPGDEVVRFGFGEAVEKEVRDDELVARGGRAEDARIGTGCGQAVQVALFCDAITEQVEHCRRSVDGIRMEKGSGGEQACQETSIAVAENQSAASIEKRRNVMEAAALQQRAKGEILHRVVEAGDAVETRGAAADEIDGGQRGGATFDCLQIRNAF